MTDTIASIVLQPSGERAVLRPDPFSPGAVELVIGGSEQSHVDLAHPDSLFYDYVRRIGTVLDLAAAPGQPVSALHLGAGALTLVRSLQVTRPGSVQHVVELERNLVPFVCEHLPLPAGTRLTTHTGDAAAVLAHGATPTLPTEFDVVVSDLYRGTTTPPHLRTRQFFEAVAAHLAPAGILIVNVADDDGLPALGSLRAGLRPTFSHGLVTGPSSVLQDARAGNAVVVASRTPLDPAWAGALGAAGPHPVAVHGL